MSQMYKLGTVATKVSSFNGYTIIKYHDTEVVRFNDDNIVLNTGGWFTQTTKTRMNQASNQFELGYRVFQQKGAWFVEFNNDVYQFENNILTLNRSIRQ